MIKKGIEEDNENLIKGQRQSREEEMARENSEKAYQLLKTLTKTDQHKMSVIKNCNDHPLLDSTAVLNKLGKQRQNTEQAQSVNLSKVMLKVIQNSINTTSGRSTTEQIFHCCIQIVEKIYSTSRISSTTTLTFKKELLHVMQAFNIEKGLIQVKETLYNSLVYTVLLDNPTEAFFDKTVGVIKGVPCAGTIQHFFGDLHARNP